MARVFKGAQGPSEDEVEKRYGNAVPAADELQRTAFELGARVERARAARLALEYGRLAYKHGAASAPAQRAEAAVRLHAAVLAAAVEGAQRARVPVSPVDDHTIRVHGRARDRSGAGVAGLAARLLDARGKALAKAATDENGYFRLDVKPRGKAGAEKGAPAPTWTLVLARGGRELARTAIEELTPGEARYRELEVPDR